MVESRQLLDHAPIDVSYAPQRRHRLVPVEVVDRAELMARIAAREVAHRQRTSFHQLVVCTRGHGTHHVDYEEIELSEGTLLRIHPGQVQQFEPEPAFDAHIIVWPIESHHADPAAPAWFPGSSAATHWQLEGELFAKILGWVDELRTEQDRFDGSARYIGLMQALLCSLLLRLAIEVPEPSPNPSQLPRPYLELRQLIEHQLYERPTVAALADMLGYSSRTLDRACQQVSGQTAKGVLDDRVALEVRRLLTHTDRPVAGIGADFGFSDPSNFSKFVKRHLGRLPGEIRDDRAPSN
ncbi:MAG: AraC family transcriptional regulator [Actinomycetota bacterium]